jgi:hypothetical protein
VAATSEPTAGRSATRQSDFDAILTRLQADGDPVHEHMAHLMGSFRAGLFAGGDDLESVQDNLDLERWFRVAKGHERRIHGHRHVGVRVVQEGATLVQAWTPIGSTPSRSVSRTSCRTGRRVSPSASVKRSTAAGL